MLPNHLRHRKMPISLGHSYGITVPVPLIAGLCAFLKQDLHYAEPAVLCRSLERCPPTPLSGLEIDIGVIRLDQQPYKICMTAHCGRLESRETAIRGGTRVDVRSLFQEEASRSKLTYLV